MNEYLLNHNNQKIIILENDYDSSFKEDYKNLIFPNFENLISSIYTYDVQEDLPKEIDSERKKFNKKFKENVSLKSEKINYHLKFTNKSNLQNDFKEDAHFFNDKISVSYVRNKFKDMFGKNSIKEINIDGKKKGKTNEEGFFDVKVTSNFERPRNVKYSYNYFNILYNYDNLEPVTNNIRFQNLDGDTEINLDSNVFLIKYDNPNKNHLINLINPDILIIKDSENTYDKNIINEISELTLSIDSTVLFFSINKNNRLSYKKNLNSLVSQTYDNNLILSELISNDNKNKKDNIFTHELNKNNVNNIDYNINYQVVNVLEGMDELSNQFIKDLMIQ